MYICICLYMCIYKYMRQPNITDAHLPLFTLCAVNDVKREYMLCMYAHI